MATLDSLRPSTHVTRMFNQADKSLFVLKNLACNVYTLEQWAEHADDKNATELFPYGAVEHNENSRVVYVVDLNAFYYTNADCEEGDNSCIEAIPSDLKLTMEDLDNYIGDVSYVLPPSNAGAFTVCTLTCANGLTVSGDSGVLNTFENIPQMGKEVAYNNAKAKLWQILGFSRMDKLTAAGTNPRITPTNAALRKLHDQMVTLVHTLEANPANIQTAEINNTLARLEATLEKKPSYNTKYVRDLIERVNALTDKVHNPM